MAAPKGKGSSPAPAGDAPDAPEETPEPAEAEGGLAASPPGPDDPGEPTIEVPMKWVAVRERVGGNYSEQGLTITWPHPVKLLQELVDKGEADPSDNLVIVPRPADLVEGVSAAHPRASKPVKGRLPHLVLYPYGEGNNVPIWTEYLEAHPPRTAHVSRSDFRNRPLSLPKAEKASKE